MPTSGNSSGSAISKVTPLREGTYAWTSVSRKFCVQEAAGTAAVTARERGEAGGSEDFVQQREGRLLLATEPHVEGFSQEAHTSRCQRGAPDTAERPTPWPPSAAAVLLHTPTSTYLQVLAVSSQPVLQSLHKVACVLCLVTGKELEHLGQRADLWGCGQQGGAAHVCQYIC
jgi:hypothetical protein